jgi:hypothetical protein
MRPIEIADKWCKDHGENFLEELNKHLDSGWVYSGDDAFVLATELNRECLLRQDINNRLDPDTWYVYLYAGDLKRVLELIPFRRKYVAFRRNNGPIKVYELDKLLQKLERL